MIIGKQIRQAVSAQVLKTTPRNAVQRIEVTSSSGFLQ